MAERQPYIYTLDSVFWLTIAGTFFGFLGVLVQACIKSNCSQVKFLGFECVRDPNAEPPDTADLEMALPPIPTRTPVRR
jgi:hypothetical protein